MVKVLSSFVRGPLEPYVTGFAEELLRQGYSRSSAGQDVCFLAHLDPWMLAAEGRLAPLGVLPAPAAVALGPVEALLGGYRAWLLAERGLTHRTVRGYVDCVRPFV